MIQENDNFQNQWWEQQKNFEIEWLLNQRHVYDDSTASRARESVDSRRQDQEHVEEYKEERDENNEEDMQRYFYFTLTVSNFRIFKIKSSPSANFALQPTNSLKKFNHHLTDL